MREAWPRSKACDPSLSPSVYHILNKDHFPLEPIKSEEICLVLLEWNQVFLLIMCELEGEKELELRESL